MSFLLRCVLVSPVCPCTPQVGDSSKVAAAALADKINVRVIDAHTVGVSFDETSSLEDVDALLKWVVICGHLVSFLVLVVIGWPKPACRVIAMLYQPGRARTLLNAVRGTPALQQRIMSRFLRQNGQIFLVEFAIKATK